PFVPSAGDRFDPTQLLLDPYAHALCGEVALSNDSDAELSILKCIAYADEFDWGDDARPRITWNETVIYECHIKGMTMRHPGVLEAQRGRYLGLTAPGILAHLRLLGVTTLELLPVHHHVSELSLRRRKLSNY